MVLVYDPSYIKPNPFNDIFYVKPRFRALNIAYIIEKKLISNDYSKIMVRFLLPKVDTANSLPFVATLDLLIIMNFPKG